MSNTDSDYEVDNLTFDRDTRRRKSKSPKEPTVPEEVELQERRTSALYPQTNPEAHEGLRTPRDLNGHQKLERKRTKLRTESFKPSSSSSSNSFANAPIAQKFGLIFGLIFDLASCALAIAAFFVWSAPSESFNGLINHWAQAPISDIQLVPSAAQCPATSTALTGSFFGHDFICDCGADNIKISSCSSSDSLCTPLSPAGTFDLPTWRYFKICVERHPSGTQVNAWNRRSNCGAAGWKNCTAGADPICVPEATPCPLTHFSIVNGGPSLCPAGTEPSPAFPGTSDSRYLCKAKNGAAPLVDSQISVGGECLMQEEFNPYTKKNPQKGISASSVDLSRPPFPCHSSALDDRYITVDQRLMGSVFKENRAAFEAAGAEHSEISYWVNNQYPVFYKFSLRPEVYFTPNCSVSRAVFHDVQDNLDLMSTSQAGLPILSLFVDALVSIPWALWICTRGSSTYHLKTTPFLFKAILNIVLNSAVVILAAISFHTIWQLHSQFSSLRQADCADPLTHDLIENYNREVISVFWMDVFICGWSLVSILAEIRRLIFLPTAKQQRRREFESSPSQLDLHDTRKINFHEAPPSEDRRSFPASTSSAGHSYPYNELSSSSLNKYPTPELDLQEPKRNPDSRSLYENPY